MKRTWTLVLASLFCLGSIGCAHSRLSAGQFLPAPGRYEMSQGDGRQGVHHFRVARSGNAAAYFYEEATPDYFKEAALAVGRGGDSADRLSRFLSHSRKGEWLEESKGGIWQFGGPAPLLKEPIVVGTEFGRGSADGCDYSDRIESVDSVRVVIVETKVCGAERTAVFPP